MWLFHNDYNEICHPVVLEKILDVKKLQMPGYSEDPCCAEAAEKIRKLCNNDALAVHFIVGGTQTNLTIIGAALQSFQGVIGADTAHINVHETGAIEATGHKVIALPHVDGKISAEQVETVVKSHFASEDAVHMVQPKMVYISNPTELGTIYSLEELTAISRVCKENDLYLFVDGARLGYGLTASDNDVSLADLARLSDVFYIGGTKVGAMFGEAVVISNMHLAKDFRYAIKQRGAMLAKGWLLGVQFDALMTDNLYFDISKHANNLADRIRETLCSCGYPALVQTTTNQIFPILSDTQLEVLGKEFTFAEMGRIDDTHRAVRFCTSWATDVAAVDALCSMIERIAD